MSLYNVRGYLVLGALAAVLAVPGESQACWFGDCFGSHSTYRPWTAPAAPVAYAAPVAAPCATCNQCQQCQPCNTCNQCQAVAPTTCCYVPQTCYRAMYENVPVTSYMPVTSTDPCTGCPVTAMKPVTSYVQQTRMVPYTTYRPVYTAAYTPAPTCSTCGTTAYYAAPAPTCSTCGTPTTSYYAAPAPSCSTCGTPSYTAPMTPAPAATLGAPTSVAPTLPTTSIPSPASVGRTFEPSTPSTLNTSTPPLKPILPAENTREKEQQEPQLLDPNNTTAAMPIQRGHGYIPVGRPARWESEKQEQSTAAASVDNDGWRPASR